jgi:dipeptidyl aminopeptidase/acylaminoacyl peptidase
MEFREAEGYGASGASDYNDVRAAATYLRTRADVDPSRVGAWGGSYGGFLTAMALARNSDLFRAGVDFHGVHNWATELNIPPTEPDYKIAFDSSPMAFVKTWRSPALLIHGDDDPDVQFNQTVMLASALRKQGVAVQELILPYESHEFLLHSSWVRTYKAAIEFLNRNLR